MSYWFWTSLDMFKNHVNCNNLYFEDQKYFEPYKYFDPKKYFKS